jgi:hypothetical protein
VEHRRSSGISFKLGALVAPGVREEDQASVEAAEDHQASRRPAPNRDRRERHRLRRHGAGALCRFEPQRQLSERIIIEVGALHGCHSACHLTPRQVYEP